MVEVICISCKSPKASIKCGLCACAICKNCTEFLDTEKYTFMSQKPEELSHEQYCPFCYTSKVQPTIRRYNEILRRAKVVIFIDTARRKPLPLLEKSKDPILVQDCTDREETILRLAFLAAEKGYNAVIKASVDHKKVRNFGYQKMSWHGNGFPAQLDSAKLERQEE